MEHNFYLLLIWDCLVLGLGRWSTGYRSVSAVISHELCYGLDYMRIKLRTFCWSSKSRLFRMFQGACKIFVFTSFWAMRVIFFRMTWFIKICSKVMFEESETTKSFCIFSMRWEFKWRGGSVPWRHVDYKIGKDVDDVASFWTIDV